MNDITDKVRHVLNAPHDDGTHTCHWPGCTRICKPAFFACRGHWFTWPEHIRRAIWAAYQTGQEVSKTPSRDYLKAATAAHEWAVNYERTKTAKNPQQGKLEL